MSELSIAISNIYVRLQVITDKTMKTKETKETKKTKSITSKMDETIRRIIFPLHSRGAFRVEIRHRNIQLVYAPVQMGIGRA